MSKSLAPELLAELTEQGFTLGSVESLTAGLFGARFCEVPGASKAYLGGLITYDPKEKIALAHVPAKTIAQYGVVSTEVAKAMAEGGSRALQVDLCVAVTGNAGPTTCPGYAKVGDVDCVLKSIEKAYGKGSVMRIKAISRHVDVDVIPSGSFLLDQALGVGGYPKGRIVEIYGPESSGKTTLALHAVAEAQKKGGRAAYVDAEHAIDPEYAAKLGVDIDELILSQPDSGEQALEIVEMLAQSGAIDVIVVDSVAALVPQAELDGVMADNQVGLQARLMSKAMRKLAGILAKTGCLVIFINQLREKVGALSMATPKPRPVVGP
jgi:PncC family amidohydrolase